MKSSKKLNSRQVAMLVMLAEHSRKDPPSCR